MKIVEDRDNQKVFLSIKNSSKTTRRGIRQGFYFLGRDLRKTAQDGIKKGPKSGRIYLVKRAGGQRSRHQASAPGEYPANLSGTLRRGIRFEVRGAKQLVFGAEADHAPYLEHGTTRMAPRPFLHKAVRANERNARNHFAREIERAYRNEAK